MEQVQDSAIAMPAQAQVVGVKSWVAYAGLVLLAAVLFFGAVMVAGLVLSVVGSVVLLVIGKLFAPLAVLLGMLLTFAFITAVLVVVCGGGYLIWRDTFAHGDVATEAPSLPHQIEA